jgi:hypothetical protein
MLSTEASLVSESTYVLEASAPFQIHVSSITHTLDFGIELSKTKRQISSRNTATSFCRVDRSSLRFLACDFHERQPFLLKTREM